MLFTILKKLHPTYFYNLVLQLKDKPENFKTFYNLVFIKAYLLIEVV